MTNSKYSNDDKLYKTNIINYETQPDNKSRDFFTPMISRKEPPIIISVGGSLIVPNGEIDTVFLQKFNTFIRKQVAKGRRFFIVAGGGKTARRYRDAGKTVVGDMSNEDLDWLGIHSTRLNAHLLRTIFQDIAHHKIIDNYEKKIYTIKKSVVIGSGWKPGWSTDYDAAILARDYGANIIINLSNIDWVYDKDPIKNKDAKPIKRLTWEELERLVGKKWLPGINTPFDPVATQLTKQLGLTVVVTNGKDFSNVENIIDGEAFEGTVIMPFKIDASFYDREYYTGKKGEYRFSHVESIWGSILHLVVNCYRAILIKLFLKPKNCLDVGCGTGGLVEALRMVGIDAWGLEISKAALELADHKIKKYLTEGDIIKIPYPKDSFDLVLTFDVMEHLERKKIRKAIEEMVRVSKKFVFHKIYTRENTWISLLHRRDFSHIAFFTRRQWSRIFNSYKTFTTLRGSFFKLPSFFETIFLLRKKT